MFNNEDHIRLSCIRSGLSLKEAYKEVNKIENRLDDNLKFAFSLKLGYLSSNLTNLGTGIKVSLMVHLPALYMVSLINKALKAITQVGFSVKGFFQDGPSSLGNMYQLSNIITLGQTEEQIIESLINVLQPLIEYERKAREEMHDKRGIEIEDKIFRAYGILTQCRTITSREAIDLLSYVRLGVSMNIIRDISINRITSLLILCQKSHIQKIMSNSNVNKDVKMINYLRAKIIRENLL
jgi:protein arginine kinase